MIANNYFRYGDKYSHDIINGLDVTTLSFDDIKKTDSFLVELISWARHKTSIEDHALIARELILEEYGGGIFLNNNVDINNLNIPHFVYKDSDSFAFYENEWNCPNLISTDVFGSTNNSRMLLHLKSYLLQLNYSMLFKNIDKLRYVLGPISLTYLKLKHGISEFNIYSSEFIHKNIKSELKFPWFTIEDQKLYENTFIEEIYGE